MEDLKVHQSDSDKRKSQKSVEVHSWSLDPQGRELVDVKRSKTPTDPRNITEDASQHASIGCI